MEEYLITVFKQGGLAEGLQILFLLLIIWLVRKAQVFNGGLEERLKRHMDERIQQLAWRLEQRMQRQKKTENIPETLKNWQGGAPPFFPPMEE